MDWQTYRLYAQQLWEDYSPGQVITMAEAQTEEYDYAPFAGGDLEFQGRIARPGDGQEENRRSMDPEEC